VNENKAVKVKMALGMSGVCSLVMNKLHTSTFSSISLPEKIVVQLN
jgi:hypothetical protein